MSTESLNRTSEIVETPSQYVDTQKRVNVDVLKQRLIVEKKKEISIPDIIKKDLETLIS